MSYKVNSGVVTYDNVFHFTGNDNEHDLQNHNKCFYTDNSLFVYFKPFNLLVFYPNSN